MEYRYDKRREDKELHFESGTSSTDISSLRIISSSTYHDDDDENNDNSNEQ